jgi:hypothetical protein
MFKKCILILCIISTLGIFFPSTTFGEDGWECPAECKIKDGTPDFLLEYFNTVRKITSNVRSEISKNSQATGANRISRTSSNGRIQRELLRTFNLFWDWTGYYSTFEFYITLPLTQSVPYPVKRDQEFITNQVDTLTKLLENITGRGQQDIPIEKPCEWVEDVCKIETWTARWVLWLLLMNTKNIGELYRLSILWKESEFWWEIQLVNSDFKSQFAEHYNAFTAENCSRCKGNFTEKVETAMTQITDSNKWSTKWTQRWIDAWNMLIGNVDVVKQREYERQVLSKELWRQWIKTSNSDVIVWNLDRYNNQWFYSIDNNFIANTFSSTSNNLWPQIDTYKETLRQKFEKQWKDKVPMVDLVDTEQDVQQTQDIKNMIDVVYQTELPFASLEDTATESLQTKLVNYHISLTEIIAELDKVIPTSEKVCNDQASWLWQCSY